MEARAMLAPPLAVLLAGCVPAEDTGQPVYGSVAFSLSVASTHIDLSDGWSFTLEHYFAVPSVSLSGAIFSYGAPQSSVCSTGGNDNQNSPTLVDYVLGTTIDVNRVVPNGACTDLTIDPLSHYQLEGLKADPGLSDADRAAYLGDSLEWLPTAFVIGTATRAGETKRVSLRFSGGSGAGSGPYRRFMCSPIRGGAPVTLGMAAVRQTFHFAVDLASLFPGSPPAFGPIASADSNHDGVVTADELGVDFAEKLALQIEAGWRLAPGDGTCKPTADGGAAAEGGADSGVPSDG